jgi:hypothetical protein
MLLFLFRLGKISLGRYFTLGLDRLYGLVYAGSLSEQLTV